MFRRCSIGLKSWEDVKAGMLLPDSEIKKYDSEVFDFAERKRIMEYMCHELEDFIAANTGIVSVMENGDLFHHDGRRGAVYQLHRCHSHGEKESLAAYAGLSGRKKA